MLCQIRLFDQPDTDSTLDESGEALGTLHVAFNTPERSASGWGGKVRGSDYLVWGMNHRRVTIEFASGERAHAVIRATGDLLGIGERPEALAELPE